MISNTSFWNVGKAGVVALSVLAAFAALAVFAPIDAHAATRGSITFCNMIADEDGDIVTEDDNLPQGEFSLRLSYKADDESATSTYATVEFEADGFNPNRVVMSGTNDAECVRYSNLPFGTYIVGEVEIDEAGDWEDAEYHITAGEEPDSISDFGEYDADESSIELSEDDLSWTVTILNAVDADGIDEEDGDEDTDGVDTGTDVRISEVEAEVTLPGVALVTWETDTRASSMVVYGTKSVSDRTVLGSDKDDMYGYEFATVELTDEVREHSIAVAGLQPGTTYYVRPVSTADDETAVGEEVRIEASTTATTTGPVRYLSGSLKLGGQNDAVEVMKLQTFLKAFGGYDVDITGTFDGKTQAAVRQFQARYASEVLAPWGLSQPTGNVHILTARKINELMTGTTVPLTAAEEQEIAAYRNRGTVSAPVARPTAPTVPTTGVTEPTTGATTTPGLGATTTGPLAGAGTSTATSTRLDRGVLGNLASAVFSLPENGTELTRCIFNLIIILAIIYIITSILVPNEDADLPRSRSRVRKTMFFLAGTIIALAFALFFDMFCLVAPLLVVLVVLIIMFIMQKMGGRGGNAPSATAPLVIDNSKKTETTTTTTKTEEKK